MIANAVRNRKLFKGLTLIELLVTLGIITLIAALVLPTVKGLLSSRKASQAGLLVRNYLEAARARAIASGREVSVVLERVSSRVYDDDGDGVIQFLDLNGNSRIDPEEIFSATANNNLSELQSNYRVYNSCIRMGLAEEQRPSDAQSLGINATVTDNSSPPITYSSIENRGNNGNYVQLALRTDQTTTPVIENLFRLQPYNNTSVLALPLQISFKGNKYPIVFVGQRPNFPGPGLTEFTLSIPSSNSMEFSELINPPNEPPALGLYPFKFHLPPRFLSMQNLTMPRGTCIDLSLSGFGTSRRIGVLDNSGSSSSFAQGDYRLRFSTDWISQITNAAPGSLTPISLPSELRPVILVFGKTGALVRVYANHDMPTTSGRPAWGLKQIDVVDDVYLHVGKIDQVIVNFDSGSFPYAGNLGDFNSQIVRISANTGSVAVAPTGPIRIPEDTLPTTDASGAIVPPEINASWIGSPLTRVSQLGVLVELARRRAIGSTQTTQ